jgi:hypothetical protein
MYHQYLSIQSCIPREGCCGHIYMQKFFCYYYFPSKFLYRLVLFVAQGPIMMGIFLVVEPNPIYLVGLSVPIHTINPVAPLDSTLLACSCLAYHQVLFRRGNPVPCLQRYLSQNPGSGQHESHSSPLAMPSPVEIGWICSLA